MFLRSVVIVLAVAAPSVGCERDKPSAAAGGTAGAASPLHETVDGAAGGAIAFVSTAHETFDAETREGPVRVGCHSACECKPGYGCFHGTCASGTAAVFCCTSCPAGAPAGQMCDWPDGGRSSCGAP
jgi:hypothetical protein